jgi:alcohol/geraniol dehydrogenase (NADP+)
MKRGIESLPESGTVWMAQERGSALVQKVVPIPQLKKGQVLLRVDFCGVCHSDIHLIDDDWGFSRYPLVPGHEILGTIIGVGSGVHRLKVGDQAGVGWQGASCGNCSECSSGHENFCEKSEATCVGRQGGYGQFHIAEENFCFRVPPSLARAEASPLFCGGITVFSPLRQFGQGRKLRVGIVGLGGLGHLAVKLGKAMGHEVTVFTHSKGKQADALALGAHEVVWSADEKEFEKVKSRLDLVLVTANADIQSSSYLKIMNRDGVLCFVGIPPKPLSISVDELLGRRLRVTASPIGSPREIEEMVRFCADHEIVATAESFPMGSVNEVLQKVKKNEVRYRAILVN